MNTTTTTTTAMKLLPASRAGRRRAGVLLAIMVTLALGAPAVWPGRSRAAGERKEKSAETTERQKEDPRPERPKPKPLAPGECLAFLEPEGQLFPSLLLASSTLKRDASTEKPADPNPPGAQPAGGKTDAETEPEPRLLGDANGLVGVRLRLPEGAHVPAHVRVELKENALMEPAVLEAELTDATCEYLLQPTVSYKFDALLRVAQPHPLGVSLHVTVDGRDLGPHGVTVWVRSLNDCLYAYQNPDDENDFQDLAWMFAAFVNEDHPAVRALLRDAQSSGVVEAFDGYRGENTPGAVLLQVFALWDALQRRGLRYADIGTVSSESDSVWSMHVRFLDESLDDRQANCVDGSVLLASVLRKIGLRPYLILEPGHMFLGFDLDAEGKNRACLETTFLGTQDADLGRFQWNKALDRAARRELKRRPSWKSFHAALDAAMGDFKKNRKRYERDDDPEYQVIDIEAARRQGILPIAHDAALPVVPATAASGR